MKETFKIKPPKRIAIGDPWYASSTLNVPEGVTNLGSKILEGNTTIKEVVIPSTVTNFGGTPNATGTGASGGMFYKSAVEKITLPEGLTEIPAAAFNQALNLKEVNIPSTVTTIGIHAFAGTGLTELTISDNVTSIGYGAFRDMTSLTTVTIEGDSVHIPTYAFRSCSSLTSIYLKGENVTFGSGQVITDADHNNYPNGTTVYVANPVVEARLKANGQFKGTIVCETEVDDNGMWEDADGNTCAYASDATTLTTAINNGAETVYLSSGTYTIPGAAASKTLTISGSKDTVIDVTQSVGLNGGNITFNGVTVLSTGGGHANGIQHSGTVIYNNATIVGSRSLYGSKEVFNNCTFDLTGISDYIWVYGANEAEFNNCIFNTQGKALLIYNEGDGDCKVTVKGCTFNASVGAKAGDISNQNCAAIEIYNYAKSGTGLNHTLITENNTVDSDFSGEWRIKNFLSGGVVTVNGVEYTQTALDGKLMTVTDKVATFD